MNGIESKTALVIAGSRGIGAAVARRLGKEGAVVSVGYRSDEQSANDVVESITSAGGRARAVQIDVAKPETVASAFKFAADGEQVDILVNAAGISVFAPFGQVDRKDVENNMQVNGMGAFNVLDQAATKVADNGCIVHFSTGGTKMAIPGGGVYAGSKAAGENMALGLAKEIGQRGVRVNVVMPGPTETDGLVMPKEQIEHLIEQTPLGRLGQPEDVADVVCMLCSDDARWISGQCIGVNGGIL